MTFQFRLVDVLFTAFTQDRVQQRLLNSSLTLEIFKVFTQDICRAERYFPVPDGRGTSRFGGLHGSPRRQGSTAVRGALRPGLGVLVFDSQARWSKRSGLGGGGWLSTPRPWTCISTQPSPGLRILNEGAFGASSAMPASTVDTYFASVLVPLTSFPTFLMGDVFFSVFRAMLPTTVDTCMAYVWLVFYEPLVSGSHLPVSVLPEACRKIGSFG